MLNKLRKYLSNAVGWRTSRKILVIESDDWGSVRIKDKVAYETMRKAGLDLERSNFTRFDSLETNDDLERLFDLLNSVKDRNGRTAAFTPMAVVANPDFDQIQQQDFEKYSFETVEQTFNRYPKSDRVLDLWKAGIDNDLFVPQFHGREHLNVQRWMRALKNNDEGLRIAFDNQSFGVSYFQGRRVSEHLAAFDPEFPEDIKAFSEIIQSGGEIFERLLGYRPAYFVASNSPEPKSLESELQSIGVKYLTRYKLQRYPLGTGKFQKELNWLGKVNGLGQIVLTRNCGFEPSSDPNIDWVNHCLKEIKIAFAWKKPAVISSHRVNYAGSLSEDNASSGLKSLKTLLEKCLQYWPDIEFMTSVELGDLIVSKKKVNAGSFTD
jgi:hypothetical protein